jgi:hypothetical protein
MEVHFRSRHESGNTLWILGAVCTVLRENDKSDECEALQKEVMGSQSYLEALKCMNKRVHLVDDDEYYDFDEAAEK